MKQKTELKVVSTTTLALSVIERIHFASILPREGTMTEMDLSEAIEKRVGFTPDEIREIELVSLPEGRVAWNPAKGQPKEFIFESYEMLLIQHGCRVLDERKLVTRNNKDLVRRFLDNSAK